ncbi:MAG: hypothetical protein AW07_00295 [Candidatus Accumulibacter sp. SK-11]|nr:MAG: hypothetical protein AW07_00295 [Candidatus Accumulibacter sp. SK-11]
MTNVSEPPDARQRLLQVGAVAGTTDAVPQ